MPDLDAIDAYLAEGGKLNHENALDLLALAKRQRQALADLAKEYLGELEAFYESITVPDGSIPDPENARIYDEMCAVHRAALAANAQRESIIVLLKEQLARFEGQAEMKGRA